MNSQPSILVMDDSSEILEQLQTVLQREGYQVQVAVDGRTALRLIETKRPDLIVSDLLLPGLAGYEVWKRMRANKALPRIPIVVISALDIPPTNQAWRPSPEADWQLLSYDAALPKPVDLRRFERVVKKLLHPDQAATIPAGPSIMLATADETVRAELAGLLENNDFGLVTLETIDQVPQAVKSTPPAALILDGRTEPDRVKEIMATEASRPPNTLLIVIVDAAQEIDPQLQKYCHGFLPTPLHAVYTLTHLNSILELHGMRQRTRLLSDQLVSAARNISDIQHALQAQNKELEHINYNLREMDSQREKLANMTVHDLKSPLGSILGTLNFLITDPDLNFSEINQNLLNGAVAAGNQMLRMIETMLDRYRFEKGKFEVYHEPFDLATIIDLSVEKVRPFLTLHSLDLNISIADSLPPAYGDINVAQRILENLLDNAIKYSPASSIIAIEVASEGDFLRVSIEDQGPGIPENQLADMFDRLAQVKDDKAARSSFAPSLDFCRLAAEVMGGSIGVASDGRLGARFTLVLPTYED